MSSPCVNCRSYPCACPLATIVDGRYTFNPVGNPGYQPCNHCLVCHSSPCICKAQDFQTGPEVINIQWCPGCRSWNDCICYSTCDENCADADCCGGCLSEEEPREMHNDELFNPDNWKHRSSKMVCGTCMWFAHKLMPYKAEPGVVSIGRCRKKAPTLNGWPVLYENDWCGDHKLDETKV